MTKPTVIEALMELGGVATAEEIQKLTEYPIWRTLLWLRKAIDAGLVLRVDDNIYKLL